MAPEPLTGRVRVGVVGAGRGGAAVLELLLGSSAAEVVVVVDPRPEAPGLARARSRGIPTAAHHLEVFTHAPDLVLELTGRPEVLHDLLRAKPPGTEVIGASGLRFFWELLTQATEQRGRLQTLFELTQRHLEIKDTTVLLPRIAAEAARFLRADGAGIRLRQGDRLRLVAAHGFPSEGVQATVALGESASGWVVEHNRALALDDLAEAPRITPRHRVAYVGWGFRAMLAVPLRLRGEPVGVLFVLSRRRRQFGPQDVEVLTGFADHAALAIQNAYLFEALERRSREAEALARAVATLAESLEFGAVAERIVQEAVPLFGVDVAVLWGLSHQNELEVAASSGSVAWAFAPGTRLPTGAGGVMGLALSCGEPRSSPDILADPSVGYAAEFRQRVEAAGLRAVLAAPLRARGRTLGALAVGRRSPHAWTPEEAALLQALGDHAALALDNSRMYGDLREALARLDASQGELVRTERLRALGEMAAGVAHNFNNVLSVILARAELLLRGATEPAQRAALEAVRRAALDGAQIVRRIQEFTGTRTAQGRERVDLHALAHQVVELARPRWRDEAARQGVSYQVDITGGPVPPVLGRSAELREVLLNLLFNALEAMPAGGRVGFELRTEPGNVVVRVADTGCGMPEEVRRRVFEPFFTTKPGRGTGLGLAVAWGIIQRHGGAMEVESTPGVGSVFTIRLPRAPEGSDREPAATAGPPGAVVGARILVVEDEPDVRAAVRDALGAEGYVVVEAADGREALARCTTEAVDLVVTDLSLPGLSGWEVAAACRRRVPPIPVGLLTGWGEQVDPARLREAGAAFVVAKPFHGAELTDAVTRALRGAPGRDPSEAVPPDVPLTPPAADREGG